jgi:hypothetical protein
MAKSSSRTAREAQGRKKILVFGDWVVDDYWVMGLHRSPTASRTGRTHYRSLHPLDGSVRALCGAGRTASVLYDATTFGSNERLFDIVGIGCWHPKDDYAISQLLTSRTPPGNPHQLTSAIADNTECELVNLAHPLFEYLSDNSRQTIFQEREYRGIGTTRMIRIFQNTGTRIDLLERIDWELQAPFDEAEGVHAWFPSPDTRKGESKLFAKALAGQLPRLDLRDVAAVVIKDLTKGCVSSVTVRWLRKYAPKNIPWFVSSKSWRPSWFEELPNTSLRLLMIPQVAALTAAHAGRQVRWLTNAGIPTQEAIDCVDELTGALSLKTHTMIAVLPNRQQALFRGDFGAVDCQVQRNPEPVDLDFEVAMASVLLPSLVTHLVQQPDLNGRVEPIRTAASFTDEWMKREVERIAAAEDTNPPTRLSLELGKPYTESGEWTVMQWKEERKRWKSALSKCGILRERPEDNVGSIELSRAMTVLDGYICLTNHKRDVVQQLVNEARRFVSPRRRRHLSFLLTASPGLGKSALIDAIVRAESLTSYTINVAQLVGRLSVIDEFDTVATLQAQNRGAPLLVFVDEINSQLESQHVYDLFLSAIQNGEYVRGGNRFRLDPCMWVFAGTATPTTNNPDPATKAQDFESRLTFSPLSLDADNNDDPDRARLETVYLGVAMLKAQFPDVRRVTKKVLDLFHGLPENCSLRDLAKLISTFENVQLGKVDSTNVPVSRLRQIKSLTGFDFSGWNQSEEDEFVKIVAR